MTKAEITKILAVLKANYSDSYKIDSETMNALINTWYSVYKNVPAEIVQSAVMEYIASDSTGYAPKIGQLNEIIYNRNGKIESAEDAWLIVKNCIRNCGWDMADCKAKWEKMPEVVKAMYKPSDLYDLGMQETLEYEHNRFLKNYKGYCEEQKLLAIKTGNFERKQLNSGISKFIEMKEERK